MKSLVRLALDAINLEYNKNSHIKCRRRENEKNMPVEYDSRLAETFAAEQAIFAHVDKEQFYQVSKKYGHLLKLRGSIPHCKHTRWYTATKWPFDQPITVPCSINASCMVMTRFEKYSANAFTCRFDVDCFKFKNGVSSVWLEITFLNGVYRVSGSNLCGYIRKRKISRHTKIIYSSGDSIFICDFF